jgi:Flp pilus assembly CpaF family ATPase
MNDELLAFEDRLLNELKGKFVSVTTENRRRALVTSVAKRLNPAISPHDIDELIDDMLDLGKITPMLTNQSIEDIMINNTSNIFIYDSKYGHKKLDVAIEDRLDLERFVKKLQLYATNETSKGNIMDVHLPQGSRVNIVTSPVGYDITIRNFKAKALSIIDLINYGELDYQIASRLWLYVDGFRVRPANMLIAGMPGAGKTTLLNAMFSFLRPETRVITIEETYELDTSTQENCVRLETKEDMPMVDLVKNSLRMRPDLIVIGEVRGAEANDMITAMNIGKITMGTIHASSTRDIINRLQHSPMNVPKDILQVIDALMVVSQVWEHGTIARRVVQMSEISGLETQVLLSDLYKFDYKTHRSSPILPSVTYRDTISNLLGVPPPDILEEEKVRAVILARLNQIGKRDMRSINEIVRDYYDNPEATLQKLGLVNVHPIVKV